MVAFMQYSLVVSGFSFVVSSTKSIVDTATQSNTNPWIYASLIILFGTPIVWIRNIAHFSFTYALGNILTLWTAFVVSYFCILSLQE